MPSAAKARAARTRPPDADDRLGERLREPRLADPRLADEHGDPAASGRRVGGRRRARPAPRRARRWAAGRVAPAGPRRPCCSRCPHGRPRRCRRDRGPVSPPDGEPLGVPDRLVQVRRLRQRRDAQLALEDGDPGAVLADGAGPVAGPREQRHQLASSRFVQRIEVEPARRGGDRAGQVPAASAVVASRSSTSPTSRSTATARVARQSSKSGLSRSENPARNGPRASDAARRRPAWSPDEAAASSSAEIDVDPVAVEGHGRPAGDDPAPAERRAQDGQRAPERAPRGFVVRLGPQHRGQLVPGVRPAARPPAGRGWRWPCGCRRRAARHRPGCRRVRGRGPRAHAQRRPGRTSSPWCVTVPR